MVKLRKRVTPRAMARELLRVFEADPSVLGKDRVEHSDGSPCCLVGWACAVAGEPLGYPSWLPTERPRSAAFLEVFATPSMRHRYSWRDASAARIRVAEKAACGCNDAEGRPAVLARLREMVGGA